MFIYPSKDSVTDLRTPPWIGLIWLILLAMGHFLVVRPKHIEWEALRDIRYKAFLQVLNEAADKQEIRSDLYFQAQSDPQSLSNPSSFAAYPTQIQETYLAWQNVPLPLDAFRKASTAEQLLLAFSPHDSRVLLLFVLGLLPLLYLFEHLYSRTHVLIAYLLGPLLLVYLRAYAPSGYWPDPIGYCTAYLVWLASLAFFQAPNAWIEITFSGWLFKTLSAYLKLPLFLPMLLMLIGYLGFTQFSDYTALHRPGALWSILLLGLAMSLVMRVFPRYEDISNLHPELGLNQGLARVEMALLDDNHKKALWELRRIVQFAQIEDHFHRLAELAWRSNDEGLAQELHNTWLHKAIQSKDFSRSHRAIDQLIFRGFPVRPQTLFRMFELGLQARHYRPLRHYIKTLQNSSEIPTEQFVPLLENLASSLLKSALTDPSFVAEVRDSLLQIAPTSPVLPEIHEYFSSRSFAANTSGNYDIGNMVHYEISIRIREVGSEWIELDPLVRHEERIPWTAVCGLFGACLGKVAGPRGTLFVVFKRKLFACHFGLTDLNHPFASGLSLNFSKIWDELIRHAPEGLHKLDIAEFELLKDDRDYSEKMQAFIKKRK